MGFSSTKLLTISFIICIAFEDVFAGDDDCQDDLHKAGYDKDKSGLSLYTDMFEFYIITKSNGDKFDISHYTAYSAYILGIQQKCIKHGPSSLLQFERAEESALYKFSLNDNSLNFFCDLLVYAYNFFIILNAEQWCNSDANIKQNSKCAVELKEFIFKNGIDNFAYITLQKKHQIVDDHDNTFKTRYIKYLELATKVHQKKLDDTKIWCTKLNKCDGKLRKAGFEDRYEGFINYNRLKKSENTRDPCSEFEVGLTRSYCNLLMDKLNKGVYRTAPGTHGWCKWQYYVKENIFE